MSSSFVSTRQQRFACARLPDPHLTSRWMPFPRSLTTTVFSQCSTRRFEASPRRAAPKGLPSSPEQHQLLGVRSPTYPIGLLSLFGTHAASKSSCRHLSCADAAKDELRRGVNMAVLSGASNRQVTPTWAEGRC